MGTTGNQTVANATVEGRRVQLNDWIRAGAPTISGTAVAPGTGDGLHPNATGITAAALGVDHAMII